MDPARPPTPDAAPHPAAPRFDAETVRRRLRALAPAPEPPHPDRRPGAVMAIFLDTPDGPGLLFTKRAPHLGEHPGQISFPGGAVEPFDPDFLAAALRETREEIGLSPHELEPLGPWPSQPVLDRWLIHPFAAWWPKPRPLTPAPAEVDRIIITPLAELFRQHSRECWLIPDPAQSCRYQVGGDTLWGATARITGRALDALAGGF